MGKRGPKQACGIVDFTVGPQCRCTLDAGHAGDHRHGGHTWPASERGDTDWAPIRLLLHYVSGLGTADVKIRRLARKLLAACGEEPLPPIGRSDRTNLTYHARELLRQMDEDSDD